MSIIIRVATDAHNKASTRSGAAIIGPGAVVTSKKAGTPWWVYLLLQVLGAAGWEWLSAHFGSLK